MEVGRYTNSLRTDTTEDYKLLVFLFFGTILFSQPFFFCKNMKIFVPVIIKNLCCKDWSRKLIYDTYGGMKRSIFCKKV